MEAEILRHFINKDVEILVGGVWVEGHMTPIVKGQITLLPFPEAVPFYGPTALKAENVQCIRQIKRNDKNTAVITPEQSSPIKSGFETASPGKRFVIG